MNSQEEYQLRMAVFHHPSLKIDQLCGFLTSECDDFLKNDLPQSLMIRELFTSSFEPLQDHSNLEGTEFVGVIVLYSSSSADTFAFAKQSLALTQHLQNTFTVLVEMDNSEKHLNVVAGEGQQLAFERDLLFIKLNLYNSDELVSSLNRNIYLMVENYYYPSDNQHQRPSANYEVQSSPSKLLLSYADTEQKVVTTSAEKEKAMQLIEKAAMLRTSRQREMVAEQEAIDDSIENVEKVLNNINKHIRLKLESDWFTSLKDSLYKPVEKESRLYSKIKLTQEFIDEQPPKHSRPSLFRSRQFAESIHNSKFNYSLQQTIKRIDSSLLKVVIVLELPAPEIGQTMAEVEVYENSHYRDLAFNALRKLGLPENERNHRLMSQDIKGKVETYVRQLSKQVKRVERQRTFERSYQAVSKK